MKHLLKGMRLAACTLALSVSISGCNDYVPPDSQQPPPPVEIQGIATPSSVSVVTATNAD